MAETFEGLLKHEIDRGELKAYAFRLTGDRNNANDLVQEVLLAAWKYRSLFKTGTNFGGWINRICRNTYYNQYKTNKKNRVICVDYPEGISTDTVDNEFFRNEDYKTESAMIENVHDRVSKLPDHFSEPIELLLSGKSYVEVSSIMNISRGTVASRVNKAKLYLHKQINGEPYLNKGKVPVLQFKPCGEFVAEFESGVDAANATGYSGSHISNVASGRKPGREFIWKYKNND